MKYILHMIFDSFQQLFSLNVYDVSKQFGPIMGSLMSALCIGLFGYFSQNMNLMVRNIDYFYIYEWTMYIFYGKRKSELILNGQKEQTFSSYNSYSYIRCNFSNRFKAFWNEVVLLIQRNNDIHEITETSNYNNNSIFDDDKDIFVVCQKKPFLVNEKLQLYAKTCIVSEQNNSDKKSIDIEKYSVILYSYECNVEDIVQYIDTLTENYMKSIENERKFKNYCYTLTKLKQDDGIYERWNEVEFNTTRSFDNIFFEGKENCLKQLNFFLNEKQWYYEKGIPHSIGYGLHGEPGTGKTSFIKCLAKKTGRHIIEISLKLIKSKQQLEEVFFENRYNSLNKKGSVDFSKKIIVFEDIDCIGDLVLDRKNNKKKMSQLEKESKTLTEITKIPLNEDPITLDDILNLLDGVRETPGRIIVMTSNHYDKLDPALKRPGRIDCSLHMKKANHVILQEMSFFYFKKKIPKKDLECIEEYKHSPAEVVNQYKIHKDNFKDFVKALI